MISKADSYKIRDIFPVDKADKSRYHVPLYQREYKWDKKRRELFFSDILDNEVGYFVGSFICIIDSDNASYEVVDGQQRLVTIQLLFSSILTIIKELEKEIVIDSGIKDIKEDLIKRLKYDVTNGKDVFRLELQEQNKNSNDFHYVLKNAIYDYTNPPYRFGNRNIGQAYEQFKDLIRNYLKVFSASDRLFKLNNLIKKINETIIVRIDVKNAQSAFILFESLNDRGLPLTITDLLKNKFLKNSPHDKLKNNQTKWTSLVESLGDNNSTQERFFRHYLNAFYLDIERDFGEKLLWTTRSNILDNFDRIIAKDNQSCIQDIEEKAKLYSYLINDNPIDEILNSDPDYRFTEKINEQLVNLQHIKGAPSYQILLYLSAKKRDSLGLTDEEFATIVRLTVIFFVRRNLTDTPKTRELDKLYHDMINQVVEKKLIGKDIVSFVRTKYIDISSSDEVFEKALRDDVYTDNADVVRFVLSFLAEKHDETSETIRNLWSKKNNKYLYSIEHVFPQGENIRNYWVDMVGNGDRTKAKQIWEELVHKIGNLTLTAYNSNLSDASFKTKRDKKDQNDRPIGFNNGLYINKYIVGQEVWTDKQINERTNILVKEIKEIFSF